MGRWMSNLIVQEVVDVLNMKTLQKLAGRKRTADKKMARGVAAPGRGELEPNI